MPSNNKRIIIIFHPYLLSRIYNKVKEGATTKRMGVNCVPLKYATFLNNATEVSKRPLGGYVNLQRGTWSRMFL